MENKRKKAELLAPCGNWDCVTAAVNAGADAVYLGGQLFNARAYASNFDTETLEKVCDLCHCFGMKVYITVNTLYKDTEFPDLLDFIGRLYTIGADGLIIEVHPHPEVALSDGDQSLKPKNFEAVMHEISQIANIMGKTL